MSEIEAAPTLIAQTGADALVTQLAQGRLTPEEYHAAIALVDPLRETGPRCIHCSESAVVGKTCAAHADHAKIAAEARAARPTVNLARYSTRASLTAAVIAALERSGRNGPARRFAERAACSPGMNGLCQLVREYVRLETRMV